MVIYLYTSYYTRDDCLSCSTQCYLITNFALISVYLSNPLHLSIRSDSCLIHHSCMSRLLHVKLPSDSSIPLNCLSTLLTYSQNFLLSAIFPCVPISLLFVSLALFSQKVAIFQ